MPSHINDNYLGLMILATDLVGHEPFFVERPPTCLTRPYQLSVFLLCFLELRWCSSHATSPFNHILHLGHKKSVWKKNGSSAGCSEDVIGICDGRVSSAGCSRRSWTIEDVKAMWTSTQHQWTCAWKTMSAQRSHETNVRLIAQSWRLFLVNQKWNDCFLGQFDNHWFPRKKSGEGPIPTTLMKTTIALM